VRTPRLPLPVVAALLATTPFSAGRAQSAVQRPSAAALAASVDSVIGTDVLAAGMPSVSVVITRGGETLVERAWGDANVATGQKADASTTYQIGSVSKQFTAALILKLVDNGNLALSDSIGGHIAGLRPEWNAITIEQLLNHTSGLKGEFRQPQKRTEPRTTDSLITMAIADTLAAKPGTTFIYSNTGYMLLGALVEKRYGKSYSDALRDEIAKPLGLATLHFCDEKGADASSYMRAAQARATPFPSFHPSQLIGSGGICATAGDLAKWNRALHGGRVVSVKSYTAMTTPRGAAAARNYGFGLYIRPAEWGSRMILHDGTTAGYAAANVWLPDELLSVTVLYNAVPRVPTDVDGVLAQLALGLRPKPRQ
jgi:CubicO group peptidase (beta-lactamase class C family)